ncbi:MAG: ABC transporter ATP-binding protein [Bradymonadales bacterium]|nr:ABC transporter ATP-binding protein [Bradymonadales bacterium]
MLLELDHLTKYYGKLAALKAVSASVKPGCVGLLGPNGAGKSTLLRVLLGLLHFQAGQASVLGFDVRTQRMEVRRQVGYMPEQSTYFPGMDGLQMVAYGAELSGIPRHEAISRAHEVIDLVGLGEERYRRVDGYSTGMRQRVKLAQALVHGPRLLFLDEPTNGLDPIGREEMLDLIAQLSRIGINILLSSHLLGEVERVCDSLVLMHEGEVVHYGTIADFKNGAVRSQELRGGPTAGEPPAEPASVSGATQTDQALDSGVYPLEVEVRGGIGPEKLAQELRARGLAVAPHDRPERVVIEIRGEADLDVVWQIAVEGGCEVRHLAPLQVSLEAAFLGFMGGNRKPSNSGGPSSS